MVAVIRVQVVAKKYMLKNSIFILLILSVFVACEKAKPEALQELYNEIEVIPWDNVSTSKEDIAFTVEKWNAMPFLDFKRRIAKDLLKNHLKKGDTFDKEKLLSLLSFPLYEYQKEDYIVLGYPIGKEHDDNLFLFFIIHDDKIYDTLFAKISRKN